MTISQASSPNVSTTTNSSSIDQIIHVNAPISTKLTDSNFLSWKNQIQLIIEGHDLESYLYNPPPDPTSINTEGETILNPIFLAWNRQDKLLNAWIRSSLSDSILAQVMSSPTCKDLWKALESYFSTTSRAKLQDLKRQLQTVSKGDSNCTDYLLRIRQISDELSFIGSPITEEDLVTAAINGLGSEFISIKAALLTVRCHSSFSFCDLRGLLLSHESMMSSASESNPTAFLAGKPHINSKNRNSSQYRSHNNYNPNSYHPRTSDKSISNTNFTSDGSTNTNSLSPAILAMIASGQIRIPCQICQKMGHLTRKCYKRYNSDPDWKPPPQYNAYNAYVADTSSQDPDSSSWIVDSGATHHVTNDVNNLNFFFSYKDGDKLQVGNGLGLDISHIGSQQFKVANYTITLHNVLCVPTFSANLISLSQLLHDNPSLTINFTSSSCSIKDLHQPKQPPLQISSSNGLYKFKMKPPQLISQVFYTTSSTSRATTTTWHARLGHPSTTTTLKVINSNKLPCIRNSLTFCTHCIQAKAHVLPFSLSSSSSSKPLELVHSDVWGPCPVVSSKGYTYYVTFIDDFSHFVWIYFLKHKSDVVHAFTLFKSQAENLLNTTIKTLRTDGGAEYKPITTKFTQILHQTTCPHTPQQNGVAERKHRHIVELSLATMSNASIPTKY
jgi:gag-polypeptide of LTR copia-type/GAG-pre-integrase domain/Integrase core domain